MDKEFGFAVDPKVQIRGHDVRGDLVEWMPCNEREHMICPQERKECFRNMIDSALTEKLISDHLGNKYWNFFVRSHTDSE